MAETHANVDRSFGATLQSDDACTGPGALTPIVVDIWVDRHPGDPLRKPYLPSRLDFPGLVKRQRGELDFLVRVAVLIGQRGSTVAAEASGDRRRRRKQRGHSLQPAE